MEAVLIYHYQTRIKKQIIIQILYLGTKRLEVKQQSTVDDGEIAAVLVDDNEEATLKRIKHVGNQVLLIPDNTDGYSPLILNKENPGRVLGKVIEVRRKF